MSTVLDPPVVALLPTTPALRLNGPLLLPAGVVDLVSFRRWSYAEDFPDHGRIDYLDGVIWVDLSRQQFYTHNQVKTPITTTLDALTRASGRGRFSGDRMRLSHPIADLSVEPDGMFIAYETFQSDRVRLLSGTRPEGAIEVEGTPDMVLEVVSDSSVQKDNQHLPERYARAGIAEFWRVDARVGLRFEILRLSEGAQQVDGWQRSPVFDRWFRLTQTTDPLGMPLFTLEVREVL